MNLDVFLKKNILHPTAAKLDNFCLHVVNIAICLEVNDLADSSKEPRPDSSIVGRNSSSPPSQARPQCASSKNWWAVGSEGVSGCIGESAMSSRGWQAPRRCVTWQQRESRVRRSEGANKGEFL